VAGSCEHGNETLGSTKGGKFLEHLSDYLASQEGLYSMEFVSHAEFILHINSFI
jgi:hypothetical protein